MNTTADNKRDEAIEHIRDSIKLLSEIIVGEEGGYSDYTEGYKNELQEALNQLITIRNKIGE